METNEGKTDITLNEREKLHTMLIYGAADDLRSPLTSIIGSLDIYRRLKNKLSEKRGDALIATAMEEARRLESFVTNILEMIRLEKGRVAVKFQPSDTAQLLRAAIERMEPQLGQHDVQLSVQEDLPLFQLDPLLFTRIFSLLLENAARYTPPHTPIIVTLRFSRDQKTLELEVRDCGQGIPKDRLDDIFRKYVRLKPEDRHIPGTGLGLGICRSLAELQGGSVTASNHPLGGAVFTLSLPAVPESSLEISHSDPQATKEKGPV